MKSFRPSDPATLQLGSTSGPPSVDRPQQVADCPHLLTFDSFRIFKSKLATFEKRGLASASALRDVYAVAAAPQAATARQLERGSLRVQVVLDGVVTILARDGHGTGPVVLTAWASDGTWPPDAFRRAAARINGSPLVDLADRMRGQA